MNYHKIYYAVRALAVLSLAIITIEYWNAGALALAILLSPYVTLYILSNENNYRDFKLMVLRVVSALLSFLMVPWLLFGVEADPQAGIGLLFGVIIQLSLISITELIILFIFRNDGRTQNR